MARAACAPSTGAPDLSPSATKVVRLFHNPAGPSTERPPALDRAALMRRAHTIARQARPHMASYRAAFAYGLRTAWSHAKARQEHRARFAGYVPHILTPDRIAASRAATRRCGASMIPF
jgi:hypothetical protein